MKTESASSASTTGTTSGSGPSSSGSPSGRRDEDHKPDVPPPTKPDGELTDAEFLARQADDAMRALSSTASELAKQFGQAADPVKWAKEYPWIAIGAGAVAGFVATAMVVPSKEEQALRKLAAIERALNPEPKRRREREPDRDGGDEDGAKAYARGRSGFMSMIAREVIGAVRPAIISLLTAGVTAKAAKPSQEEMEQAAETADAKQAAGVEPGV